MENVELHCSVVDDWFSHNESIKSLTIGEEVRTIRPHAFEECRSLSTVSFSCGLTAIGERAFSGCVGLKSLHLPQGLTTIGPDAFQICKGLSAVSIPASVSEIGEFAFFGCVSLDEMRVHPDNPVYDSREDCHALIETATNKLIHGSNNAFIPDSVEAVGHYAFAYFNKLTSLRIPRNVGSIGVYAFACRSLESLQVDPDNPVYDSRGNCNAIIETATNKLVTGCRNTVIPNGVVEIGDGAFANCAELTSITIPYGVRRIGQYAFAYCESLTGISLPDTVTAIGENAFIGCKGLPVEDNIRYVGNILLEAVDKSLTECRIREGTNIIFNDAFAHCARLTSISIPDSVTHIGYGAFQSCEGLISVRLPHGIKVIREDTFYGCSSLETVDLPDNVMCIEDSAFFECEALKNIRWPHELRQIGCFAFEGCKSLLVIELPGQVREIGRDAFKDCVSLKSISLPGSVNPPAFISSRAFAGLAYERVALLVPEGALAAYREHPAFKNFKNIRPVMVPQGADATTDGDGERTVSRVIVIPDDVEVIETEAFRDRATLSEITIPSGVARIDKDAFSGCSGLSKIHIHVDRPNRLVVRANEFKDVDVDNCELFVPKGALRAYRSHPAFCRFKNILTEAKPSAEKKSSAPVQ